MNIIINTKTLIMICFQEYEHVTYKLNDILLIINLHGLHLTEASSEWIQLWLPIPLWGHSNNSDSDPVQNTLSNQIGPVPCPKKANDKAVPVIELISFFHNSR